MIFHRVIYYHYFYCLMVHITLHHHVAPACRPPYCTCDLHTHACAGLAQCVQGGRRRLHRPLRAALPARRQGALSADVYLPLGPRFVVAAGRGYWQLLIRPLKVSSRPCVTGCFCQRCAGRPRITTGFRTGGLAVLQVADLSDLTREAVGCAAPAAALCGRASCSTSQASATS